MANYTVLDRVFVFPRPIGEIGEKKLYDEIIALSEEELVLNLNGNVLVLAGSDFTYEGTPGEDDFVLTGGTVTEFTLYGRDGEVNVTGTDLDRPLTDFNDAIVENALDLFVQELLSEDDVITGTDFRDRLFGGDGNDTLDGGRGLDFMAGGDGDDVYIAHRGDMLVEWADSGTDTVLSSTSFTLSRFIENLELTGDGPAYGIGNTADNEITGNDYSNHLSGLAGNDILDGQGGNDLITGGVGDDVIIGGDGTDQLYGGDGADMFVFEDHGASDIDVIHDFTAGVDMIDMTGVAGINSFEDLLDQAEQVGTTVVISTENDSDLILRNTDLEDLSAEMFAFAG